jgi:hypothetical protein
VHRGGRGQSFVYELLYDGQGRDGKPFLMGLIDIEALKQTYDGKKEHPVSNLEPAKSPQVEGVEDGRSVGSSAANGLNASTVRTALRKNGHLSTQDEAGPVASYSPTAASL